MSTRPRNIFDTEEERWMPPPKRYPDDEYAKTVCKIGQGHACCRYLTMGAGGWSCEKNGPLRATLDARGDDMNARGDNCEGLDSR